MGLLDKLFGPSKQSSKKFRITKTALAATLAQRMHIDFLPDYFDRIIELAAKTEVRLKPCREVRTEILGYHVWCITTSLNTSTGLTNVQDADQFVKTLFSFLVELDPARQASMPETVSSVVHYDDIFSGKDDDFAKASGLADRFTLTSTMDVQFIIGLQILLLSRLSIYREILTEQTVIIPG